MLLGFNHNFIRNHGSLGKAPSEVTGIKVEVDNKWLTLIGNASKKLQTQS